MGNPDDREANTMCNPGEEQKVFEFVIVVNARTLECVEKEGQDRGQQHERCRYMEQDLGHRRCVTSPLFLHIVAIPSSKRSMGPDLRRKLRPTSSAAPSGRPKTPQQQDECAPVVVRTRNRQYRAVL